MFSYIGLWIAIIFTIAALAIGVTYYFKFPQYRDTRIRLILVALIIALIVLALAGLLVFFVQTYLVNALKG